MFGRLLFISALFWARATETPPAANQTSPSIGGKTAEQEEVSTLSVLHDETTQLMSNNGTDDLTTLPATSSMSNSTRGQNSSVQNVTHVPILSNSSTAFSEILPAPKEEVTYPSTVETTRPDHQPREEVTTSNAPQLDKQHNTSDANSSDQTTAFTGSPQNASLEPVTTVVQETSAASNTTTGVEVSVSASFTHVPTTSVPDNSTESMPPHVSTTDVTPFDGLGATNGSISSINSVTQPEAVSTDSSSSALPPVTSDSSLSTEPSSAFSSTASIMNASESTISDSNPTLPSQAVPLESSFILQFTGNTRNCSNEKQFSDLEKQVRHILRDKAGVPTQKLSLNVVNCSKSFFMNVGVSKEYESNVTEYLKRLEVNSTKFRINDETYHLNVMTTAAPGNVHAHRQPSQFVPSSRHTNIEFVIYVALGSACAFLLTLAIVLVGCKYCRTKPYKSFDLNDVSHLSHRLEDYSLRQIPRPKSVYVDYCRRLPAGGDHYSPLEEQSGNGMVHAFDTSVVPLEDVPMKLAEEDSVKAPLRIDEGQTTDNKPKTGSAANHEYEEIDVKAVNSTENLHSQPPNQKPMATHWGVDNDSFLT